MTATRTGARASSELRTLNLLLSKVPTMKTVGGNARPGNYQQAVRVRQEEKEEWLGLIRAQVTPSQAPHFQHVEAWVCVIFAQKRRRDPDNLAMALKPMWDALVEWGILVDDSMECLLTVSYAAMVNKKRAPATIVRLKELR